MSSWLNRSHLFLFVLVLVLVSCGQQTDEEVTKLRETITAQETEIAGLAAAQLSSQGLASTAEPTPGQEQPLEDLVSVELANEGLAESFGRESYVLIYSIENGSDFPISASFDVRLYDEAGTLLTEYQAEQCSDAISSLPYTPPRTTVWLTARTFYEGIPASHRFVNLRVSKGCTLDQSEWFQALGMTPKGPESAYESIQCLSPEVTSRDGAAVLDATLENTGDRAASMVYVQAVGLDSSNVPVIEYTMWHLPRIPAGEKMRFTETIYVEDEYFSSTPALGSLGDIVSWECVAAGLTSTQ